MKISLIIPTYNRIELIPDQVQTLTLLKGREHLEVIYVDNNSRDGTFELLKQICEPLPDFSAIQEFRQGSSAARNCGAGLATGDYLWFIDDDCLPHADTLDKYLTNLPSLMPEIAGGPINPINDGPVPWWFSMKSPEFNSFLARVDHGSINRYIDQKGVFGGNMLIRRQVFFKHGGFDLRYGLVAENRGCGEEDDIQRRIRADGGRTYYVHDAIVDHIILSYKINFLFYIKQRYERGISQGMDLKRQGHALKKALNSVLKIVVHAALVGLTFGTGKIYKAVDHIGACAGLTGQTLELLKKDTPRGKPTGGQQVG